jgi:organic hydroperoxide reductase OsmC/OhrA
MWFLSIAAQRGFVVESYRNEAVGVMGKDAAGKLAMTRVTLRPEVSFSSDPRPAADEVAAMHHEAHEKCFIANSVKTDVRCEPVETLSEVES